MPPLLLEDLDHVLRHVSAWDKLRGARLFITGGTGFFGIWLLETFCHANEVLGLQAQATVLSRDPQRFLQKFPHLAQRECLSFVEGDVRTLQAKDFAGQEYSHLIHAATASGANPPLAPLEMFETIIEGTKRVLDLATQCGAQRFLLTSSGAVYGQQPLELSHMDEEHFGAPDVNEGRSAYGEGKRAAELLCRIFMEEHGLDYSVARGFTFVGPHLPLDAHFAIGNFLRDAMNGGQIKISGDGTPLRSYLYAADLAVWLWTILLQGQAGRAYNVGSERAYSILETAQAVASCFDPSPEIVVAQKAKTGVLPSRYVPSTQRAGEELQLESRIEIREALMRTHYWHHNIRSDAMNMVTTKRSCPICGEALSRILRHQRFALAEEHPLPNAYDVVLCCHCDFSFADTIAKQSDYDRYYELFSKYDDAALSTGGGASDWDAARLQETAQEIAYHLDSHNATILDIGCATGGLLQKLKSLGFANVQGLDPSPHSALYALEHFGIKIHCGSLFNHPILERFDCVILSHVLEHVRDLSEALQAVRQLVKPNGILYLEVPDATRYDDFLIAPFQDFNIEHINHFGPHSLNRLAVSCGFQPIRIVRKTIESAPGVPYPALFGLWRTQDCALHDATSTELECSLREYIAHSQQLLDVMNQRLRAALWDENGLPRPSLIWGAGQLTLKLLAETCLGQADVRYCVEGNAVHWGKTLHNVPIIAPHQLTEAMQTEHVLRYAPLVIGTTIHQDAITARVRTELMWQNPIVVLR
jgi:dTDP-glucose 4,6-dehydratase